MPYAFQFTGHGAYTPDGKLPETFDTPEKIAAYNAAIEAVELVEWAKAPSRFLAYVKGRPALGAHITTWRGIQLGTVATCRNWRNALTSTHMATVRVIASNGAEYTGTLGVDWSELVNLRRCKRNKFGKR